MDDTLSLSSLWVGSAAFVVMSSLMVFGLLTLPLLRGLAMLFASVRWLARLRPDGARMAARGLGLERPLELAGLSAPLADLARQTRHLALELRRWDARAERWPDDRHAQPTRLRWLDSFLDLGGFGPQTEASREVFEWLRNVDALPPAERAQLDLLGIDPERVRELLTSDRTPSECMRSLAGVLASIDERLVGAGAADYRGSAGLRVAPAQRRHDESKDEHQQQLARRQRWAAVLAEHGRGLSRMAARHSRTPSEREDLEQDIALTLWQALPSWRGESSLQTFVYKLARFRCFRLLRRRGRDSLDSVDIAELAELAELADHDPAVDVWLSRLDDLAQLERARAELPEGLGSTLTLRLEGKSYAEIAAALGISEQNVSVRLTRARQQLAQRMVAA
jgi:RNA polymerase sigma factor (sigma-70 family)